MRLIHARRYLLAPSLVQLTSVVTPLVSCRGIQRQLNHHQHGAAASVIDYPESIKLLREATSIYLRLPLEKLLERAGSTGIGRQALAENAQAVITERFKRRDPHYREVASYTCELGDIPQVDDAKIIKWLKLQTQIG